MKNLTSKLIWITLFSIAMGMLESAVVIYLRKLYYPEGFAFPLKMMDAQLVLTELIREVATFIMLISIGVLTGKTKTERFAWFIYSFAIWDIFYYVFLKLLIGWPVSFMTWDILFLLPTTWVGPVIAPILLSLAMIVLALSIALFTQKDEQTRLQPVELGLLVAGSFIVIVSFTYEYSNYILKEFRFTELFVPNEKLMNYAIGFIPHHFPWWIFGMGVIAIGVGIVQFIFRSMRNLAKKTD